MGSLDRFLAGLLDEGRAVLRDPPEISLTHADRDEATPRLAAAYATHALDVAGPPIPFRPEVAAEVAHWFQWVCWFVVDHNAPAEMTATALTLRLRPVSASDHLSADLILRFVPPLRRRLAARADGDVLPGLIEGVVRSWPLSYALLNRDGPPPDPGALGDHPGLWLLCAERLQQSARPGLALPTGPVADRVGWVEHALTLEANRGG